MKHETQKQDNPALGTETLDKGTTLTASMVLVTARKEMGLSQKEVADALFLSLSFIKNIDGEQIDVIPKKAFIKGYLRSYAKLVNLDPDGVVDLYCPKTRKEEPLALMRAIRPDAISKISFTGPVLISSLIGLVCLVTIIFFVWYYANPVEEKRAVQVTETPVVPEVYNEGSIEDAPANEEFATKGFSENISSEGLGIDSSELDSLELDSSELDSSAINILSPEKTAESSRQNSASNDRGTNEPATLAVMDELDNTDSETPDEIGIELLVERSLIGLTNYITVNAVGDAGGSDELHVVFSDDCWFEIEDRDGNLLYGDLARGSDDLTIIGNAPFKLLIGKPDVVSVMFNSEEIDLVPFITPARTAKLVLGEVSGDAPGSPE